MNQRTTRKMQIGTIDRKVTAIKKRKQAREDCMKEREDKRKQNEEGK